MSKIFETVKSALVDNIASLNLPYAFDLHNELYGAPQHYIYYAHAEEATAELDMWECIGAVQKYEQDQFGEVYTPLSDACRVANMVVYIMGYELLEVIYGDTEYFGDKWNDQLSAGDLADMLTLAEKWFAENPDGLQEIWENLDNFLSHSHTLYT